MNISDITFVGSGLASTATLIELFGKLLDSPQVSQKLTIAVIEKHNECWLGIPYGSRSSINALSITCVHDFIYEPERPAFFAWLKANRDDWSAYYRENGGFTAAKWLDNNLPLIENEDWETVYIPRFLLGRYVLEKFNRLLKQVEERQLAEIRLIQAEVIDVKILDGGLHEVIMEHPGNTISTIITRKVVIATGSVPVKKMYKNADDSFVYINDIYEPSVNENLKQLHTALSETSVTGDRNVLVIGSNASSIELLYLLEGMEDMRKLINKIIVISPSGMLPYPISNELLDEHPTPSLDQLKDEGNYTLPTLLDATSQDLKLAVQNGANVGYIATVITTTLQLITVLGEEAKRQFIGAHGMRMSNMFRRSGHEYKNGSQLLIDLEQAVLLKGKFVSTTKSGNGVTLNYLDTASGQQQTYPLKFMAVINCTGSDYVDQTDSRLIANLFNNKIGKMNLSGKGFEVNEKFEISSNLYVMGPLLGGNYNKLIHFWHLENAPRIMYLAPYLADELMG